MTEIQSKTILLTALLLVTVINVNIFSSGNGLSVGETSPNPEFIFNNNSPAMGLRAPSYLYDYKLNKTLLIAFMPDISSKNNYADVMTSAFDAYFAEGLAFGESYYLTDIQNKLKVLVVSNNDESQISNYLDKMDIDFDMVPDINMDMAHSFGISSWNSSSDGSFVFVIDNNNIITYANYDYKGEGEKLRAVQKEIFSQLNIGISSGEPEPNSRILVPGDDEIDFSFQYAGNSGSGYLNGNLSDYIGKKNVIIAFYPAPFSMSCSMELSTFDSYAEKQTLQDISNSDLGTADDVEILMISSSGLEILKKWKDDTKIKNVKLVSDLAGHISSLYGSFNPLGYSNRTLFIIDKAGKISYVDRNYAVNEKDFSLVKEHLRQISRN